MPVLGGPDPNKTPPQTTVLLPLRGLCRLHSAVAGRLGHESLSGTDSIPLHTTPATLCFALPLDKFFPLPLRAALFSSPWKEPVLPVMDCTRFQYQWGSACTAPSSLFSRGLLTASRSSSHPSPLPRRRQWLIHAWEWIFLPARQAMLVTGL